MAAWRTCNYHEHEVVPSAIHRAAGRLSLISRRRCSGQRIVRDRTDVAFSMMVLMEVMPPALPRFLCCSFPRLVVARAQWSAVKLVLMLIFYLYQQQQAVLEDPDEPLFCSEHEVSFYERRTWRMSMVEQLLSPSPIRSSSMVIG